MLQASISWTRPEQPGVVVEVDHGDLCCQVEEQLLSSVSPHLAAASNEHEMLIVWRLLLATMRHNNVHGL